MRVFMRICFLILFSTITFLGAMGQTKDTLDDQVVPYDAPAIIDTAKDDTFVKVDVQASFVGGESAFQEYVKKNFIYPFRCADEGIGGYVMLRFVVDIKGNVTQVSAINQPVACPEFNEEAIRVIKSSPKWIPAQINGRFVNSWRQLPIRLNID